MTQRCLIVAQELSTKPSKNILALPTVSQDYASAIRMPSTTDVNEKPTLSGILRPLMPPTVYAAIDRQKLEQLK